MCSLVLGVAAVKVLLVVVHAAIVLLLGLKLLIRQRLLPLEVSIAGSSGVGVAGPLRRNAAAALLGSLLLSGRP